MFLEQDCNIFPFSAQLAGEISGKPDFLELFIYVSEQIAENIHIAALHKQTEIVQTVPDEVVDDMVEALSRSGYTVSKTGMVNSSDGNAEIAISWEKTVAQE
jgi:hypothetical protein